jgi:hypothetical protein
VFRGQNLGHAMVSVVVSSCNGGRMECGALALLFPAFDGSVVGTHDWRSASGLNLK